MASEILHTEKHIHFSDKITHIKMSESKKSSNRDVPKGDSLDDNKGTDIIDKVETVISSETANTSEIKENTLNVVDDAKESYESNSQGKTWELFTAANSWIAASEEQNTPSSIEEIESSNTNQLNIETPAVNTSSYDYNPSEDNVDDGNEEDQGQYINDYIPDDYSYDSYRDNCNKQNLSLVELYDLLYMPVEFVTSEAFEEFSGCDMFYGHSSASIGVERKCVRLCRLHDNVINVPYSNSLDASIQKYDIIPRCSNSSWT